MDPMAMASIGSSLISGVSSAFGAKKANKAARGMMEDNQAWMHEMRNSQYQAAMADMEAAGLNPMLAYSQGGAGGLTTQAAPVLNELAGAGEAASTALQARRLNYEVENMKEQNRNLKIDAEVKKSQKVLNLDAAEKARQEAILTKVNQRIANYGVSNARTAAIAANNDAAVLGSDAGQALSWIDRISKSVQGLGNNANSAKTLVKGK